MDARGPRRPARVHRRALRKLYLLRRASSRAETSARELCSNQGAVSTSGLSRELHTLCLRNQNGCSYPFDGPGLANPEKVTDNCGCHLPSCLAALELTSWYVPGETRRRHRHDPVSRCVQYISVGAEVVRRITLSPRKGLTVCEAPQVIRYRTLKPVPRRRWALPSSWWLLVSI